MHTATFGTQVFCECPPLLSEVYPGHLHWVENCLEFTMILKIEWELTRLTWKVTID